MSVAGSRQFRQRRRLVLVMGGLVIRFGVGMMRQSRRRVRPLQPIEDLTEERRLRPLPPLGGHFAFLVFVLRVTDDATGLFDAVVDHRHDGVIGNTALARTVIVQHVAGPKPALLHALPRQTSSDHRAGGTDTDVVPGRQPPPHNGAVPDVDDGTA
jgi:hypothetical protein